MVVDLCTSNLCPGSVHVMYKKSYTSYCDSRKTFYFSLKHSMDGSFSKKHIAIDAGSYAGVVHA